MQGAALLNAGQSGEWSRELLAVPSLKTRTLRYTKHAS